MDGTLDWYDATTGASPAVVETTGEVDLNLDGVILAALDQMIAKVHDQIQAMADRNASDVVQVAPASLTTGEPKITTITPATPASPTRRVLFSGGFAPFLPAGAWDVYANTTPTTAGTPVLLVSGTTFALAAGTLSPVISFSGGSWPSTAGYYYLVVSVSVSGDQDVNPANNTMAVFDEALTNSTNNTLANATSMGITLALPMSIQVAGNLTAAATN